MRTCLQLAVAGLVFLACGPSVRAAPTVTTNPALLNGDFSAPLDSGWTGDARNFAGYHKTEKLADGGVKLVKVQNGHNNLAQQFVLASTDVVFATRARLRAEANQPDYHAYAAITLNYLGADGEALGTTRFYTLAGAKPWPDTPREHYIAVAAPGTWQDLSFNLNDELEEHLPGVDPEAVKSLRVTLTAFGSGTSSC